MGIVMRDLRGRVKPKRVSQMIREKITKILSENK